MSSTFLFAVPRAVPGSERLLLNHLVNSLHHVQDGEKSRCLFKKSSKEGFFKSNTLNVTEWDHQRGV